MNKKVEWDIIVPIKLPISLKNVEPGKLHPSLLREIPQGGKLHYSLLMHGMRWWMLLKQMELN